MHNKHLVWLWLSALLIALDQLSKYWAEHILQRDVVLIFFWFDFQLAHNTGAAFGFLNGAGGWQHVFFGGLALLVSQALIFMMRALLAHERHLAVAYSLIIAGAIGNLIDRIVYQYVVDFIHVFYSGWHFPNFNIADSVIFIGAALLIAEAFGKPFLNKTV